MTPNEKELVKQIKILISLSEMDNLGYRDLENARRLCFRIENPDWRNLPSELKRL